MNKTEAERVAGAVHALRPDWHVNGLLSVLWDERLRDMAYRDITPVFVALALDSKSRTPNRIHEAGDWWHALRPMVTSSQHVRAVSPDDCDICHRAENKHRPGVIEDHAYRMRNTSGHGVPMTTEQRQEIAQ